MDVKRTVKLMPRKPVYGIKRTPITNSIERVELTTEEIRLCLITKCMVDEYLPDGSLLRLDLSNYNNVIQEDPLSVSNITVPITEINGADTTVNIDEINQLVVHSNFSSVPPTWGTVFNDDFNRVDGTGENGWKNTETDVKPVFDTEIISEDGSTFRPILDESTPNTESKSDNLFEDEPLVSSDESEQDKIEPVYSETSIPISNIKSVSNKQQSGKSSTNNPHKKH